MYVSDDNSSQDWRSYVPQPPKPNWVAKFHCLYEHQATTLNTTKNFYNMLREAGLGTKSIVIENYQAVTEAELKERLEEEYPPLKMGGGFELMCCGKGRDLHVLSRPYTPAELKSQLGPHSKIFIRPLENDLPLDMGPRLVSSTSRYP